MPTHPSLATTTAKRVDFGKALRKQDICPFRELSTRWLIQSHRLPAEEQTEADTLRRCSDELDALIGDVILRIDSE